jgi:hypothetical protein
MEIILVVARLIHVNKEKDGRTEDLTKVLDDSGNFAKASKNHEAIVKHKQLIGSATNFVAYNLTIMGTRRMYDRKTMFVKTWCEI